MTYSAKQFAEHLFGELALDKSATFYVAYSGGVDSTVLLHLMSQLRKQHGFSLIALHVNHNIHDNSEDWAGHCTQICASLDVPLLQTSIQLQTSSESEARTARYKWFQNQVGRGNVLCTAHHSQDRAETVLFNLMRGAGSAGLSSLRSKRAFYGSTLVRPLLGISKEDILTYADKHQLNWVEDPSNQQSGYSRNHIRNEILPVLKLFRADAIRNIARAGANLEQENSLLREIAISDLVNAREYPQHPIDNSHALCFEDLRYISASRKANLVRFWLGSLQLHIPSKRLLEQLVDAFETPPASTAVFQEDGIQYRFYRGYMYVMPALQKPEPFTAIDWRNINQPIDIYKKKIRVDATDKLREMFSSHQRGNLRLASRNQLINPKALQGHSLNMKKWLQEIGVPPWRRQQLPLLAFSVENSDLVLGPVDQQMHSDWVSLDCPVN